MPSSISPLPAPNSARPPSQSKNRTLEIKDGPGRQAGCPGHGRRENLARFPREREKPVARLDHEEKFASRATPSCSSPSASAFPPWARGASTSRSCQQPSMLKADRRAIGRMIRRPERSAGSAKLNLAEVVDVTHNVKTFRFKAAGRCRHPFRLPARPIPDAAHRAGRHPTRRSYTIASTPTWRDRIEITVKREPHGLVSRWLHDELKVG